MTIAVLWVWLYLQCKIREACNIIFVFNWIKALLFSAARWTETEQTDGERKRERERGVCARAGKARPLAAVPAILRDSERMFGRFILGGKKIAKGVCDVAKLATLCISISPTTNWAKGQTENTRCVNRALIKLVPLKWICVNALLT